MNTFVRAACGLSLLSLVTVLGCNSDAADDTAAEPSRNDRISTLASDVCDHYADTESGCPGYAADHEFASEDACQNNFRDHAEDLWPNDRCGSGQIDNDHFEACINRAQNYACSQGGDKFFDAISALNECKADAVCTDPAK